MKSRLLTWREFEALIDVDNVHALIAALTKTAYRKPVELALARTSGMECIAEALRNDLISKLGGIPRFYDGQAREMVAVVYRTYDIHNIKAILRGLEKNISAGEILASLLPIGQLEYSILAELARAPGPRACADLLASMGYSLAQPLLKLRVERPGVETDEMELALDQWHFDKAFQAIRESNRNGRVLYSALQLEADQINLLSILRLAHAPAERKYVREWLDTKQLKRLFVGPGRLSFSLLAQAGDQDNVESAVEILAGSPYEKPLRKGLGAYAESARLSDLEKQLTRFRLKWMSGQITRDPLGIGVVLGYLALKVNEVNNIRWIAQATSLGMKGEAIRAEMVFVE